MTRPTNSTSPDAVSSNQTWVLGLLLVLTIPNFWVFSGSFQLFQPPGWVDPGIYLGYFLDLKQKIIRFGDTYFSMRLPFTGFGALLYAFFPPEIAQKLLVLSFNSLAAGSLFAIVSRRSTPLAGVAASFWLTLNPIWLATVTRGYVDGPAMALLLSALALLDGRDGWRFRPLAVLAAGALIASAGFTHPVALLLTALAGAADIATRRSRIGELLADALWLVAGAVAATLILGVVSLTVGGKFLFFLADTAPFARSVDGQGANYRYLFAEWVPIAYRLAPPIALSIAGLVVVVSQPARTVRPLIAAGLVLVGGVAFFLGFWDSVIGAAMFQSSFYSSYMILGQALIVGGIAGIALRGVGSTTAISVVTALCVVGISAFQSADPAWRLEAASTISRGLTWSVIACLFASGTWTVFTRWKPAAPLLLTTATIWAGVLNYDTRRIFKPDEAVDFATTFRSTIKVADFVAANVHPPTPLVFWFDREALTQSDATRSFYTVYSLRYGAKTIALNYWDSLTALWLWDRGLLGATMPDLSPVEIDRLAKQRSWAIVTFCLDRAQCEAGAAVLERLGFVISATKELAVNEGYVPFITLIIYLDRRDTAEQTKTTDAGAVFKRVRTVTRRGHADLDWDSALHQSRALH